jgi:hypothetical protein
MICFRLHEKWRLDLPPLKKFRVVANLKLKQIRIRQNMKLGFFYTQNSVASSWTFLNCMTGLIVN